jgi:hypothetical protein
MLETVTAAHCRRCGRTGHLTEAEAGYWCAWCGEECEVELRSLEVRVPPAHLPAGAADPEEVKLQPLRITAGWRVLYNNGFYEVDPTEETIPWWWIFKQDMLTLVHDERGRLLDLGWVPEMDVEEGRYQLGLYAGGFQGELLHQFESRDRRAVVQEIERILSSVTNQYRGAADP